MRQFQNEILVPRNENVPQSETMGVMNFWGGVMNFCPKLWKNNNLEQENFGV